MANPSESCLRPPEASPSKRWLLRRRAMLGLVLLLALASATTAPPPAWPADARVRSILWSGAPVPLRVALERTTAITFPAPIARIVTTASKDDLSLESAGTRLYLTPLREDWRGEIFVVLDTDDQVVVLPELGAPGQADLEVRLLTRAKALPPTPGPSDGWTPLRLMRAMLLRLEEPGLAVTPVTPPTAVYDDGVLRLQAVERWRAPKLEGLILEAENLTALWLRVAVESLAFPGLLAVHTERDDMAPKPATAETQLAGQHRTRVYLIRVPE